MLIEIFANICMSMVMFIRGMQEDEIINRKIELLKETDWFKQMYMKHEDFYMKDADLRYVIGWAKVEKSLSSEKRSEKLRKKIEDTIRNV
ncbi:MAG TPA: hypothetical protein VEY70_27420 [Metabacillus sp.]|nr:hypothetical protein [Metabacillus sp.]